MARLFTYLALLVLGLYCSDGAIIDNSYNYYRLPTTIQPDRYKLKVITHLENPSNLTFEGEVSIRFKVIQDTNNITIHSQNLTIDESQIKLKSYDDDQKMDCLLTATKVPEQDYFIIQLCQILHKNESYELKLLFSGILNEKLQGYYRSSYVVKATNETRWLSITQFEPAHARAAFPCLDEPAYKAKFIIWMGHHKNLTAISNMPMEKQTPLTEIEDFVWSIFEESVPMSTYLVAYSVNDFVYKQSEPNSKSNNNTIFRTWARPDAIDQCDYASEVGPKVLKYYEHSFGIPFPLKKVDEIAIPDFSAGAMENWGLITYSESLLLFTPNVSSNFNKLLIAKVIAHELVHQWFGNLVTMEWWSDLWLNKGFATYIASLGVQHLSPEWDAYNEDSLANMLTIFRRDAQLSSHPLSQPILNTSQISESFDSISYRKGSAVLRMLHSVLRMRAFYDGVRNYLKEHEYGNAEQDDLWAVFNETAHRYNRIDHEYDLKTIMDSWTLKMGFPLVTVKRNYETGSVEISQHRFLENKTLSELEADKVECWWVPLSYTTASEMDFENNAPRNWLECDEEGESKNLTIEISATKDEWVLFNIQLMGIYRVMYDTQNWYLLNKTMHSRAFIEIHVMNRAQLIDDVIWLAWSGYHDYDITFDFLQYLKHEKEYLPWKTALKGLGSVGSLLKPFESKYKLFKSYMLYIMKPVYYYLGGINAQDFEDASSFSKGLLKSLIAGWACHYEMEDCVDNSIKYFAAWRSSKEPNSENSIPVDHRKTVYCTAIRHGNEEDWQFLWQRYKESNVASEKNNIINALGCSRNSEVLSNYINMTFDRNGHIREQDSSYVFSALARNQIGFPILKEYVIENIDKLNEYYGANSDELKYLIFGLADSIITPEDLNKLSDLIQSKKSYFQKMEKSIENAIEIINFNLQWIDHNVHDPQSRLQSRLNFMDYITDHECKG